MGKIYDDWERLVQAVLHREQNLELCRQHSRSPSQSSISSDVSLNSLSSYFRNHGVLYRDDYCQPLSAQLSKQELKVNAQRTPTEKNKLVLVEGCNLSCTLEDLLGAPAELLGRGTLTNAFKVILSEKVAVVVKSLKESKATRWAFEKQMPILARIRHENIVAVKAYFCFEDRKYLVYEYYNQQSVDSLLHDTTGGELRPLDWDTRLKISIGAARGLAHIHAQCSGKLVHGNIKASNIFLNSRLYGCVSDLCFAAIDIPVIRYTVHHAPEIAIFKKHSQASDVYSYGILLLELLTRKSPVHATISDEVVRLNTWVKSVTAKEGTIKVFDEELMKPPIFEEEMVQVLLVGMHCVAIKPEQRPKMADVLKMLENIRTNRRDQALKQYIDRQKHQVQSKIHDAISRLRELNTLKGHIEELVKRKGLDIETIHYNYTV